ncbi:MAG: hypothetical protein ACYTJ0_16300 [Planctomycetota bacterium]
MRRPWLVAAACFALVGCAGGPRASSVAASRTGGWTVDLQRRSEDGAAAYYAVGRDGSIRFGGGLAALQREPTWSGTLTDEQIDELVAMLERLDWVRQPPKPADTDAGPRWNVTVIGPPGRRRFAVRGEEPGLIELESVLDGVARQRNEPFLEHLPRPSGERPSTPPAGDP